MFNQKSRYIIVTALIFGIVGFAGAFAVASNKKSSHNSGSNNHSHSSSSEHSKTADKVKTADIFVDLEEDRAAPDSLTVPVGKTVQFNTKDGKEHNLSLGSGGEEHEHSGPFHSGAFGKDEAWRATFTEVGTYQFHDHNNPKINVLIVVYKPAQ